MELELRHLRYFAAAARYGSISRAAKALHVTQPTVSRQLQDLTAGLGERLFVRGPQGIVLTDAGRALERRLPALFEELDRLSDVVRGGANERAPLTVGVPPGLPHDWFLRVLDEVEADGRLVLRLWEATTEDQRDLLNAHRIDMAIAHADPPEFLARRLCQQPLGVALRPGRELAPPMAGLGDLGGFRILAHSPSEVAHGELELRAAAEAAGVSIDWAFRRFLQHTALVARAADADGVILTAESARLQMPGWQWLPLRDSGLDRRPLAVVTWVFHHPDPPDPVRRFLELLAAVPDDAV